MVSLFASPLLWLTAAGAVPALIAIYCLRSRCRRMVVSSLFLWADLRDIREGGRFQRLRTPLLFFLELCALLLIIGAAAGPLVPSWQGKSPVVIILDDSYSMLARRQDGETPRSLALHGLIEDLAEEHFPLRVILAGRTPQFLTDLVRDRSDLARSVGGWKCLEPEADLSSAMSLAAELSEGEARVLVVSDQKPAQSIAEKGKIQWWAFGSPLPNLAFVNAVRATRAEDVGLVEISNFSSAPVIAYLEISAEGKPSERHALSLGPAQRHREIIRLAGETVKLQLDGDSLSADNFLLLLPQPEKKVRVQLDVDDPKLRALLEKTLEDTEAVRLSPANPHLLVTDRVGRTAESAWLLSLHSEKDAAPYLGPFVTDRTHPLTQGLSLEEASLVWGAGTEAVKGIPVISAGNVPLVTDAESVSGRHEIYIQLRLDYSNLQNTPDWPILIWNLIQWRRDHVEGFNMSNVRIGAEAILNLPETVSEAQVTGPAGNTRVLPAHGGKVAIRPEEAGLFHVRYGKETESLSANVISADESNLLPCSSGRWGTWITEESILRDYQNIAWIFLLLALLLLATAAMLVFYHSFGNRVRPDNP